MNDLLWFGFFAMFYMAGGLLALSHWRRGHRALSASLFALSGANLMAALFHFLKWAAAHP